MTANLQVQVMKMIMFKKQIILNKLFKLKEKLKDSLTTALSS